VTTRWFNPYGEPVRGRLATKEEIKGISVWKDGKMTPAAETGQPFIIITMGDLRFCPETEAALLRLGFTKG
jgi:hypothetical protein